MLKFMISWLLFALIMGGFVYPFIDGDFNKMIGGGLILGFFASVLSHIEGNTRK